MENKTNTVKYYEFNQHDYYAMLAVEENEDTIEKAFKLYVEYVGGENVDEIKEEGEPTEIDKNSAILKYFQANGNEDETVRDLTLSFNRTVDLPLLVDGSLL
ncbi:hypothetical protein [Halobacillus litoralis]|uniref:hypothetical protein n=1 Tax=Halobacillus litoralis TaxID=45668 RepID=UPI001CD69121|nr:hypothetical protein [Halobacillus litoralis]MCA1021508.1 hypothetical protein [Halobacillus litoralis]